MKKTEWFPADVKPARKGVYRVQKSYGEAWCVWNGEKWSHGTQSDIAPEARHFTNYRGAYPVFKWRGLAEQPK